jgi:hypothetical protein
MTNLVQVQAATNLPDGYKASDITWHGYLEINGPRVSFTGSSLMVCPMHGPTTIQYELTTFAQAIERQIQAIKGPDFTLNGAGVNGPWDGPSLSSNVSVASRAVEARSIVCVSL